MRIFKRIFKSENSNKKLKNIINIQEKIKGNYEFENSMNALNYILDDFTISNIDKITVIDTLLKSIRYDIQNYYATKIIYKYNKRTNCIFDNEKNIFVIPDTYLDETGNVINIKKCGKKKIYFSKDIVVSRSWNLKKYKDANINIYKNIFEYQISNHFSIYYRGLDISFITNGFHSSFAGIINKKGYIVADIINVEKLFGYIDIDEELKYFDIKTKEILSYEVDFRIALLYKISKIKFELLKKIKFEEKYIQNKDTDIFFIGNFGYEIKSKFKETNDIIYMDFTIYNGLSTFDNEKEVDIIAKSSATIIKEFRFLNITKYDIYNKNYLQNSITDKLIKLNIENAIYYGAKSMEIQIYEKDNYIKKDIVHLFCRNNLQYFIDNTNDIVIGYSKLEDKKTLRDIIIMMN